MLAILASESTFWPCNASRKRASVGCNALCIAPTSARPAKKPRVISCRLILTVTVQCEGALHPTLGKRGKTPGRSCQLDYRCARHADENDENPPFSLERPDHAAPACPGFCPSYYALLKSHCQTP